MADNQLRENKVRFSPVKGTQDDINHIPKTNGNIYFATDSKQIWLDTYTVNKETQQIELSRILMGNGAEGGGTGNVGFIYADADFNRGTIKGKTEDASLEENEYYIYKQAFSEDLIGLPLEDTLIINSNGWFFRVIAQDGVENRVKTELISSGTGGGGSGGSSEAREISIHVDDFPRDLINGKDAYITFTPKAAKDRNGNLIDNIVFVTWTLEYTEDEENYIQYDTGSVSKDGLLSDVSYSFNFGEKAKYSSKSRLILRVSENNSTLTKVWVGNFITSDLSLTLPASFSNAIQTNVDNISLSVIQQGQMDKILECYWDGILIETRNLDANSDREQTFNINNKVSEINHGYHTVKFVLSQYIGGEKGFSTEPIEFEIAAKDSESDTAIIWLGNYKSTYYNYDNIQILFNVFCSKTTTPKVHLYKEGKEIEGSPRIINDNSKFSVFEIVDFDLDMLNTYSITYEEDPENIVTRIIEFRVIQDPTRKDFGIQKSSYLTLNFDASGRSNSESDLKRATWSYDKGNEKIYAEFNNFNWYNNGWITENGKTCLRISNGAKFSIPVGDMVFAGNNDREQSHTLEFQFKIRNVQDYSNLIHNITRYKNDSEVFAAFYDSQTGYKTDFTNYDAYLADFFKNGGSIGDCHDYDDLEFDRVEKQINLKAVACGYYSGNNQSVIGVCLGPQDAFFSNGTNTVNISYVEDMIINLSAVYSDDTKLMYIYINGVLTGVIKNTVNGSFSISDSNNVKALVFNSDYCDIDLYKIRFYRTGLNVNDIVTNYAVDLKDVNIYDQNKLAVENNAINEYQFNYKNMIDYNTAHISSPIMPYIIFDTSKSGNEDKLSYAKSVKVNIGVEFVNTPLELAYKTGELETLSGPEGDKLWNSSSTAEEKAEAVKKYYKHHCPSFTGTNIQMAVQGTSSEFYPRRNYKLKTKTNFSLKEDIEATSEANAYNEEHQFKLQTPIYKDEVNIHLHKGPFEVDYINDPESTRQKYWYMDNYTAGTTKFTMKIDYMESSGSYNMGFANLVKNAYSKHPLQDYNSKGSFVLKKTRYDVANSFTEETSYYYVDNNNKYKAISGVTADNFAAGPNGLLETSVTNNSFFTATDYYDPVSIPMTNNSAKSSIPEYRTSVQGFRVLAFHKKSDGSYTYIGMYNMLLDKGSDEAYGFKPDKTFDNVLQKYVKNKKVSKIAECWEFENNSRTFCSFRDPMNRKDLSFNVYTIDSQTGEKIPVLNSVQSAPIVVDSFEYRYHTNGDILDYVMDPDKNAEKYRVEDTVEYMNENGDLLFNGSADKWTNYANREKVVFDNYKNWEKAVAWVWSTNTDSVLSGGTYSKVNNIGNEWKKNTYYLLVNDEYVLDNANNYDSTKNYYVRDIENGVEKYSSAYLGLIPYEKNKYYIIINGAYVLSTSETYDPSYEYYQFSTLDDNAMAAGNYDRLVRQCASDEQFDSNETYYTYDGEQPAGSAVTAVSITEEEFNENKTQYYKGITIAYGDESNRQYTYDTKEYRADKFINELADHFDIEYLSTYFVMTEVFECYDSRGKNAMFASWGPQKSGGEYIWYPIFYDIDTQLGINNTGIPSFEYNVDATENGNFSTSDSILWNNFYKYFKNSYILMKYKHLKGITAGVEWPQLSNAPLRSINNIESWYRTNPEVCGSIAMRGIRPLIATNLDEYYKYITITNSRSYQNGVTGHIKSDTSGSWTYDANGTYFYALQGDRSLSRQQFLTNRLEYIDSWLNQGNYARGGSNRMWGRVAANNPTNTSDFWLEDPNDANTSYYINDVTKEKRHIFDAEYWLTLTPTRSTYVTLGDDNEAYPSRKYDGINPVRFEISSIENGVRRSSGYPEQLLYVYGMNQMSDVGDMSNMYWQEFKIEGDAKHLTKLLLGSDRVITDRIPGAESDEQITWQNKKVNPPSIPSSKESSGMPLLKEVNFSNIQISKEPYTLDFTSCEKMQNFRATGSNLTEVKFAEGVALDTLYLPSSITTLELTEARLLTNLLTTYQAPSYTNGKLIAQKGLWIDGLFPAPGSNATTAITKLSIIGGNLGYDSYKLLKQYYIARGGAQASSIGRINFTNVDWSPYQLVEEDEVYSGTASDYKVIDNHYGLVNFTYNEGKWAAQIANKEIYKIRNIDSEIINQISDIDMLTEFINNNNYQGLTNGSNPYISGIIYINNSTAIDENYIRNTLQLAYPDVTFLFNNVIKRPTARFIYYTDVAESTAGILYKYVKENPLSIQTLASTDTEDWFINPIIKYGQLDKMLANYDFFGWAKETTNDATGNNIYSIGNKKYEVLISNDGGSWTRPEGTLLEDYTFYAIFKLHAYQRKFYNADGSYNANGSYNVNTATLIATNYQTYTVGRGVEPAQLDGKQIVPTFNLPDTQENFYYVNKFKGWAFTKQPQVIQDLSELSVNNDYEFVAVYEKISVYDQENILDTKYLTFNTNTGTLSLNLEYKLEGKITLPTQINSIPVLAISGFNGDGGQNHNITHIFWATENRALTTIVGGCFSNSTNLVYYEQPETCRIIGNQAFANCRRLGTTDNEVFVQIFKPVTRIAGANILQGLGYQLAIKPTLIFSGTTFEEIADFAFSNLGSITNLQIGTPTDPCKWFNMAGTILTPNCGLSGIGHDVSNGLSTLKIYISSADNTAANREAILTNIAVTNNNNVMITDDLMVQNDINANFVWITVD